jgi:hypothetical protein
LVFCGKKKSKKKEKEKKKKKKRKNSKMLCPQIEKARLIQHFENPLGNPAQGWKQNGKRSQNF